MFTVKIYFTPTNVTLKFQNPQLMKRTHQEFLSSQLETLAELHRDLRKGITMKGALVSYALLHGGKTIENRTKKIKPGWYALHTGSSPIDPAIEQYVQLNLKKIMQENEIPKEKSLPHSCIVGAFHIKGSENLKQGSELEKNGWALGPVCNFVDKTLDFETPIPTIGAITLGWNFDDIDKRKKVPIGTLHMKVKEEITRKEEKIKEELKNLNKVEK